MPELRAPTALPRRSGAASAFRHLGVRAIPPRHLLAWSLCGALGLTAVLFIQQLILGRSPFAEPGEWSDVWVAVIHCFMAAALPAAYLATLLSGRRAIVELEPVLAQPLRTSRVAALPPFQRPTREWFAAGAIGVFLATLGPWLTEPEVGGPLYFWSPAHWDPETYWHRVLGIWIGAWLGWYTLALVQVSHRLSRLAREIEQLEILDLAPLRPFARHALSNGLVAAGLATLVGLLGLDMGLTMMLLLFGGLALALVMVAVALPLLGVRDRIRSARAAELAWCDAAIAAESARLRSGAPASAPAPLADLLAYRTLVERVGALPMEAPLLRRVLLYLLIPLLSWIASAMVQGIVERTMLGR